MTQQNAAMVEQSTAASTALAQESGKLRSLVLQFDFGRSSSRGENTAQYSEPAREVRSFRGARS